MIYTTLNRISDVNPFGFGMHKLIKHLRKTHAYDDPLALASIIDINGLGDALFCLSAEPQHANLYRLYAVRCARKVQHLMRDERSLRALDVAEAHAWGLATDDGLQAAWQAARQATLDATHSAYYAAYDATQTAIKNAGISAARVAYGVAYTAAYAADAAGGVACDTTYKTVQVGMTADLRAMLHAYEAAPGCVGVPTPISSTL